MYFTRLKAKNWSVYYPEVEIDFERAQDMRQPLWIFEGLTGFGKTTLFLAFVWAMYGERGLAFHTKDRVGGTKRTLDMISRQAMMKGDYSMNVELHFVDADHSYIVKRYVPPLNRKPTTNAELKLTVKLIDEKGGEDEYPDDRINEMLPLEASQFFFFAGEMLSKYTDPSNKDTKEAIERILGFPEIRASSEDVSTYIRKITKMLKESDDLSETVKFLLNDRDVVEIDIKTREEALATARQKHRDVDSRIPDLQAKFDMFESVQQESQRLRDLQKDTQFLEDELTKLTEARYGRIKNLPFVLAYSELTKHYDRIKQRNETESAEAGMARASVVIAKMKELLGGDRCWCGNRIEEFEKKNLTQILETYMKDRARYESMSKDQTVPSMLELSRAMGYLRSLDGDYQAIDAEIKKYRVKIDDNEAAIDKIQNRIGNAPQQEIRLTKNLLDKCLEERGRLSEEIKQTQAKLEDLKSERDTISRTLSGIKTQSAAVKTLRQKYDVAEKASRALEYALKELANVKREVIQDGASKFMLSIVRKPNWDRLAIEEDYSIQLYDKKGSVIPRKDISDGEKEILALSFIHGLKHATERSAPVVIDFLLGRLDVEYQDIVAAYLDKFGDQVLYFVLDSELTENRRELMRKYAKAWYLISYDAETETSKLKLKSTG
jgi:DNA sulfur modification protein DndD